MNKNCRQNGVGSVVPPLLKTLKSVWYVKQMNEKNAFSVKIRYYPKKIQI